MLQGRKCRGERCGETIAFVKVKNRDGDDKMMPIDVEPSPNGRWFVNENEGDGSRDDPHTARYVRPKDADYERLKEANLLHMPHHATCAASEDFRKKKGK